MIKECVILFDFPFQIETIVNPFKSGMRTIKNMPDTLVGGKLDLILNICSIFILDKMCNFYFRHGKNFIRQRSGKRNRIFRCDSHTFGGLFPIYLNLCFFFLNAILLFLFSSILPKIDGFLGTLAFIWISSVDISFKFTRRSVWFTGPIAMAPSWID